MYIRTLASGSGGNCTLICTEKSVLLVDAGISMRRIVSGLRSCGIDPCRISAILVTHSHNDHISGLGMMGKHYSMPILATEQEGRAVLNRFPDLCGKVCSFQPGRTIDVAGISVTPFSTPHDTPSSAGFRFDCGGASAVVATDMGFVPDDVQRVCLGAQAVVLEANHDPNMLCTGPYPPHLQARILSRYGHLSNADSAAFAVKLAQNGTKSILLAHLSQENNTPSLARRTVAEALEAAELENVHLSVAPAAELSEEIWLT